MIYHVRIAVYEMNEEQYDYCNNSGVEMICKSLLLAEMGFLTVRMTTTLSLGSSVKAAAGTSAAGCLR